jgi:hypothetical protein
MDLYGTPEYARTCAHLGTPRTLPRSGVTILVREVPGEPGAFDARAPYPLLHTEAWEALAADLADTHDLLSFVGVVDPACTPSPTRLTHVFPDRLAAFKPHHIVRLGDWPALARVDATHRRKARRAAAQVEVEVVESPSAHTADWIRMYASLRARHGFGGAADFPDVALAAQLALPGMMLVRALRDDHVVSMSTWCVDGTRAHYHLGASNPAGYEVGAAYAVFAFALEELSSRGVTWVDLGGSAGAHDADDGLARFKRGWASETETAWLGGRVLDASGYRTIAQGHDASEWFPAYRAAVAA